MSHFKDEELVILSELGFDKEVLNNRSTYYYQMGFSALRIISTGNIFLEDCSYVKLEKCMLALINICDDYDIFGSICTVAGGLNILGNYTCPTERVLRKMLESCDPKNSHVLLYAILSNYRTRHKNAIQYVLESGPNINELKEGLTAVHRKYVENLFVFDMIIYTF